MAEEINGVPCEKMFGAIARFRDNGDLAQFRFSAKNEWVEGTASESTIYEWYGIGADQKHVQEFTFKADHPTLGHGHGPTPQEYVLHALAACITAGIVTGAAARNIQLQQGVVDGERRHRRARRPGHRPRRPQGLQQRRRRVRDRRRL